MMSIDISQILSIDNKKIAFHLLISLFCTLRVLFFVELNFTNFASSGQFLENRFPQKFNSRKNSNSPVSLENTIFVIPYEKNTAAGKMSFWPNLLKIQFPRNIWNRFLRENWFSQKLKIYFENFLTKNSFCESNPLKIFTAAFCSLTEVKMYC